MYPGKWSHREVIRWGGVDLMQPCKVIIFGGTTEGRELARILADRGALVTVSVATELGEEMLRDIFSEEEPGHFRTLVGRLNVEEMQGIIREFDICYDATHPYAVEVTANLREACRKTGTKYIRVIRMEAVQKSEVVQKSDSIRVVQSAANAAEYLLETKGNILLTTGSKELRAYAEIPRERLYVRVLPTHDSIAACEAAGIPHRNIIAMFGPFSQRMNEAMLEQYHISYLVTKEAGRNGGFEEKLQAAKRCGVKAIVIRRPEDSGVTVEEAAAMFKYQQSGKIL